MGTATVTTDAKGYFRIMEASLDTKASLVTAELPGYFKAYRSFPATASTNHIEIKLIKRNLAGTVDAAAGGEVALSNGAKVQLQPSGVVVDGSGTAYTGTVNVYVAYIDPTANDIDRTVPGSFLATDVNNNRVLLASYGMMAVELESPSGQKLQIKSGSTAKLTMPIPASLQSSAPVNMPLWFVNEQTGIWKEEGTSTKVGITYVGDVKHFTYWNCDLPHSTNQISFKLESSNGNPLAYTYVRITRASHPNSGFVHGITDSVGKASPLVPLNQPLIMTVYDQCHTVQHTQNIGPFTQVTDIGTIVVPQSANAVVTVQGTLLNCAGTPVTSGYALVYYNHIPRFAAVNASGAFSLSFIKCTSGGGDISVLGVDETNSQQGNYQSFALTLPVTNIGSYSACGTASNQYVNYTYDGNSFSLGSASSDSLSAWTEQQSTAGVFNTYISGFGITSNNNECTFRFNSTGAVPGTYPLTQIWVNGKTATHPPISVTITSFPTAIGQFYEGSFSGSFTDAQNVTHTVSCQFRIRKLF
ncbi:MAG: hypothetical protein H0U44_01145 [Flavisolibacter sp.]|nr:hypothetical protein [Flavisolibacter sp.]